MLIGWNESANLENSLYDFLYSEITNNLITVLDDSGKEVAPQIVIGSQFSTNWSLPVIQVYLDSRPSAPRQFLGSNRRDTRYLIILDIRANNNTVRMNLSDWIMDIINEGFPYYEYTMNGETPSKAQNGRVSFDIVNNLKIDLGEDVDLMDKYRHRISISCWISKKEC